MTDQNDYSWEERFNRFLKHHGLTVEEDKVIRMVFKHLKWQSIEFDDHIAISFHRDLNVRVIYLPADDPIFTREFVENLVNPRYTLREVYFRDMDVQKHIGNHVAYQLDIVDKNIALSAPQQAYYSGTGWELDAS